MTARTSATSTSFERRPTRKRTRCFSGVPSISEAVDGIDRAEFLVGGLELAPDALDVRGDGGVVDHDVRVAHQLLAILHMARIARERVHQPELGQREIDAR